MATEYEKILEQIKQENKNVALPEVPAKVRDAEEERTAEQDKRIASLETGMTDIAQMLSILVNGVHANQQTPQTFVAPASVAPVAPPQIAILEPQYQRVFPFAFEDKKGKKVQSAHIALKPVPTTTNTFHNPTLFSPGTLAYLYAEYVANPTEFGKNLVEAYQASIPYQKKK